MPKPAKTFADYVVIAISPALIMLLVGSLCFFLIEVFFRGPAAGNVRWVMFWFVMAVVLVTRIGIEQGTGPAAVYGLGLAAATWLYLVRIHPAFILGMILLAVVWWCAHKLTWDCTLIDDVDDASGSGLVESTGGAGHKLPPEPRDDSGGTTPKAKPARLHLPGKWVVYFSLAALPLFGIGQMLLPAGETGARREGFTLLFVYVAAALGLLLTTSFLGLRRYLRQRYLTMPAAVAFGWIRFGLGVGLFVLIGALLLPRPGSYDTWQVLRYQVNYRLVQASQYAARFSPHGKGTGRAGEKTQDFNPPENSGNPSRPEQTSGKPSGEDQSGQAQEGTKSAPTPPTAQAEHFYHLFKVLFVLALIALAGWWLAWQRALIFQVGRSFLAAVREFFKNLISFGSQTQGKSSASRQAHSRPRPFASYWNPFLSGQSALWSPEQLVGYSVEALRAWGGENAIQPGPEKTVREFCAEVESQYPEMAGELDQLSRWYSQAAFASAMPGDCDWEPLERLWRFLDANRKPTVVPR